MEIAIVLGMAVVFTALMATFQTFYWSYSARQEKEAMERLRRLSVLSEEQDGMDASVLRARARDAVATALGSLGAHFQDTIEAADMKLAVGRLVGQMFVAGFGAMLVSAFFLGIGSVLVGVIAFFIPYFRIRYIASARASKLVQQLPEALDLMARSLQAGLGLNEAFRTCAEEMPMPLAGEFGRVFEEVRFGREYRDALNNLVRRNPSTFDLRLFVSSVLLARETGGNLIEILEAISNTIRGRFLFHAKVAAMTSEAKFSGLILGGLPISVGMLVGVLNPEYLRPLVTDPLGNLFIALFVFLYAVGGGLMYWVSQIEV